MAGRKRKLFTTAKDDPMEGGSRDFPPTKSKKDSKKEKQRKIGK
jgi:hypothetical protein